MFNHLNYESIIILGYTILCLVINIQALIERIKKKNQEDIEAAPNIKLNFTFLLISFIMVMFIRGLVLLLAIVIIKTAFLKVVCFVLLLTDLFLIYGLGFNGNGNSKPVTKFEYNSRTMHLFFEVCLIFYFFCYYLQTNLIV